MKPLLKCYTCGKEGHGARFCPDQAGSSTSGKQEKKGSAKKASAKKSKKQEEGESKEEEAPCSKGKKKRVLHSYMGRAKRPAPDEEPAKKPKKVKKTAKKSRAKRMLDPKVVDLFCKLPVPLELIAKHGAAFKLQAKRAVKEVYDGGHTH